MDNEQNVVSEATTQPEVSTQSEVSVTPQVVEPTPVVEQVVENVVEQETQKVEESLFHKVEDEAKHAIDYLRIHCNKLFEVNHIVFDGAFHKLEGLFTQSEAAQIIKNFLNKVQG